MRSGTAPALVVLLQFVFLCTLSLAKVYPACPADTKVEKQSFFPLKGEPDAPQKFIPSLMVPNTVTDPSTGLKENKGGSIALISTTAVIKCVAYEAYITTMGMSTCLPPTRTGFDKPYRILLQATNVEDPSEVHSWDIDDVSGGSIETLVYRVKWSSKWSVQIINRYQAAVCGLTFELGIQVEDGWDRTVTPRPSPTLLPAIVDLSPITISTGVEVYVALKMRGRFDTGGQARLQPLFGGSMPTEAPTLAPNISLNATNSTGNTTNSTNNATGTNSTTGNATSRRSTGTNATANATVNATVNATANATANATLENCTAINSTSANATNGNTTNSTTLCAAVPTETPDSGWHVLPSTTNATAASLGFDLQGDPSEYMFFTYKFLLPGVYSIQFKRSLDWSSKQFPVDDSWQPLGSLVVYAENPAYFVVSRGAGLEGQILEKKDTTIRFQGVGLNATAPTINADGEKVGGGDRVKFVAETEYSCAESSPPGGGIATSWVEGEAGLSEANATRVYWRFTLTKSGFYRVCYNRWGTTEWHQILSHSEIPHLNPHIAPPSGTYPVPTNPNTKKDCKTTPLSYMLAMTTNPSYVVVTFKSSTYSFSMGKGIAEVLCLDYETIHILELLHENGDKTGRIMAYIDIDCSKTSGACNSDERKAFLLYIWRDLEDRGYLSSIGVTNITEAEEEGELVVAEEEPTIISTPKNKFQAATVIIVVLIFVCIITIGTVLFCKKNGGPCKDDTQPANNADAEGQGGSRANQYASGDRQEFEMVKN